jgi:uncharacterized protein YjdB
MTLLANDNCNYDSDNNGTLDKNWALQWCNANSDNCFYTGDCVHSQALNCQQKVKAAWWLWARLAGWNGGITTTPVTDITVTVAGGASTISTNGGNLQLAAEVLPANATNTTVTWSVTNGTGLATINSSGLLTVIIDGTVTATATANDGSGVSGTLTITLSNPIVPVTGITVTGAGGDNTITTDNGTLQLSASVLPSNATDKTVTWSFTDGTGQDNINSTGIMIAVANGTVTAKASANDGSGVSGTLSITICNHVIQVSGITVSATGGANIITEVGGTLQLNASVLPVDATDKEMTWSIINRTGQASVNASGLVTAIANGSATAKAAAKDGSGVYGILDIFISNQIIPVSSISVTSADEVTTITSDGGTLQLATLVWPTNATDTTVTWSVVNGTGQATISSTGLVTAVSDGIVMATATANDGSGPEGALEITVAEQAVLIESINVTPSNAIIPVIREKHGHLQIEAEIIPTDASNDIIDWSVENHSGIATVNDSGMVTGVADGSIKVTAKAKDGSNKSGFCMIAIINQNEVTGFE